jgi:ABC-2 type transport system permease protein
MLRRILTLTKKEFIHLKNDWMLPVFMLVGGLLELIMIAWATSRPITNLPILIIDQDQSNKSREIITEILTIETFAIYDYAQELNVIEDLMVNGEIIAALIFPPDFSKKLLDINNQAILSVILNGTESVPATAALQSIQGVIALKNEEILVTQLSLNIEESSDFNLSVRVWFNEQLNDAYYTTPAELGMMLEFTILLFAALSFSRERELGTLEQLLVMPFSTLEIIIGKSLPVIIIGLVDFSLLIGMVNLLFDVPIRGSLILLFSLALLYIIVELGKGLVISVVSKTQHQAFLLVMVLGMVDIMFTGYAAPVESMPKAIQFFANIVPANHWLNILRGIMLKGSDISILWPQILALVVLGLIIGTISLRVVRRALN